jgi:carbon monoxide dehydrogenase subunit G
LDLSHRFTVPTSVDETWAHFNDIASVAECFPGATVTSVEGDTFQGSCKVKLGPIALVYNGSGTFVEKDETAHRFVVDAKGKDKRGNGTAGAKVTLSMAPAAAGTDVEVLTDLAVTGKPAQFGRGVMQDVSDKLLGQFVACLETRLAGADDEPSGGSGTIPVEAPPPPDAAPADAAPDPAAEPAAPAMDPAAPAVDPASGPVSEPEPAPPAAPPSPVADTPAAPPPAAPRPARPAPKQDDAINLGTTVLPILFRTYWKQGLVVLVLLALVIWLIAG